MEKNERDLTPQPLIPFKQYYTYKVSLDVHSDELTVDETFNRVVLHVINWLKARIGNAILKEKEFKGLWDYPNIEKYTSFDLSKLDNIRIKSLADIKSFYVSQTESWALRIEEPDTDVENKGLRGRIFITDVAVDKNDGTVVRIGVRITCREPIVGQEEAKAFRPKFLDALFDDSLCFTTESGLDKRYCFCGSPIIINGKSKQDCDMFFNSFINNSSRRLPIIFCPETIYKHHNDLIVDNTDRLSGICYVVVIEKTLWKILGPNTGRMMNQDYFDTIDYGDIVVHNTNGVGVAKEPFFVPLSHDGEDNEETINDFLRIEFEALRHRIRKAMVSNAYDLTGILFYRELKTDYFSSGYSEDEKNNFAKVIDELEESVVIKEAENIRLQNRIGELTQRNNDLEKDNEDLKAKFYYSDLTRERSKHELEDVLKNLNRKQRLNDIGERTIQDEDIEERIKELEPLLHMPCSINAKELVAWIEKYYSNTIIVLERAAKMIKSANDVDLNVLCMMIHYIHGYTLFRRESRQEDTFYKELLKRYDVCNNNFEVSLSAGANTKKRFSQYKFKVPGEKEKRYLDRHVKYGRGNQENTVRVYFHYHPELKKSIIGSMPYHLPTMQDRH